MKSVFAQIYIDFGRISKGRRLFFSIFILTASLGSGAKVWAQQSGVVQLAPTAPHEVTSQVCGTCHQAIYDEWKSSMHAQSTALTDPIHEALYRNVMGDPREEGVTNKAGKYPVCLQCHAPNAAMRKKTKLDSAVSFGEGVNCIFCHTITDFKGTQKEDGKLRLGLAAYEVSTTALQSPSGKNYIMGPTDPAVSDSTFHPFPMVSGNQALVKSDSICMGCHDKRNNSHGVPLCVTGDEIEYSETGVSCQSCHMPTENGHVSHRMAGGHDANIVRRGVFMSLDADPGETGLKVKVNLTNRLPHKFPTGAPFRNVVLKVAAFDDTGQKVWENPAADAFKEESESILVYRLGDGTGQPSMPPPAKEALSDTRLNPHESRTVEFEVPAAGVKKVKADLYYNLLWPNLLKKLENKLSDDLKAPKHIATAEKVL